MDWTIKITTENAVWGNIKTWGPPVVTLLLGLSIGVVLDLLRQMRKVKNIRTVIRHEIEWIKGAAEEFGKILDEDRYVLVAGLLDSIAQTHVYDAYLGQLCILKKGETEELEGFYHWIKMHENALVKISDRAWQSGGALSEGQRTSLRTVLNEIIENTDSILVSMEHYGLRWYKRMWKKAPEFD